MPLVLENELVSTLKLIQQSKIRTVGFYYIIRVFLPTLHFYLLNFFSKKWKTNI